MIVCTDAFGDIRTTLHGQLRSTIQSGAAEARSPGKEGSAEICVFCHTPAGTGILPQSPPAWQKSTPPDHAYTIYDDIGRGQYGDKLSVGSQSIACLSCHDTAQAFGVSRLTFDHPFGVPYRGFLKNTNNHQSSAPKVKQEDGSPGKSAKRLLWPDEFRVPNRGVIDNRTVWWVSPTGNGAQRTSTDLPLYARTDEDKQEVPYIECTSCHNPHSSNPLFLRVKNTESGLCLTCHDK